MATAIWKRTAFYIVPQTSWLWNAVLGIWWRIRPLIFPCKDMQLQELQAAWLWREKWTHVLFLIIMSYKPKWLWVFLLRRMAWKFHLGIGQHVLWCGFSIWLSCISIWSWLWLQKRTLLDVVSHRVPWRIHNPCRVFSKRLGCNELEPLS